MKKIFLFSIVILASILIACKNSAMQNVEFVEFTTYEKEVAVESPDGAPAGILLRLDIPNGEGMKVAIIDSIIRSIIAQSEVANELGTPKEGCLKDICDDYVDRFQKGIAGDELTANCEYHLEVLHGYQNAEYICFHVADGVFGNGGPMEREMVARLSDGQILEQENIICIPENVLMNLTKKYAQGEQKETLDNIESFMSGELVPDEKGCKFHYATSMHLFDAVYFPLDDIKQYLTEEGRKVFSISKGDAPTETKSEEAKEEAKAELGKGELGIFDLRGPVKKCTWNYLEGKGTYTFDENGFWQTIDGKSLKKYYDAGIDRDKAKRIIVGHFEFYETSYEYNAEGLKVRSISDGVTSEFTYDKDGYVAKEHVSVPPDMGDEEGEIEEYTLIYTILEKDKYGNWTKRKCDKGTETRTIEYYQ